MILTKSILLDPSSPTGSSSDKNEKPDAEFQKLQATWEDAYDKMYLVSSSDKVKEILDLSAQALTDPKPLEDYLQRESSNLKPEEVFFLQMSIQVKKFRNKETGIVTGISEEQFNLFRDKNEVSQGVLDYMAQKVMNNKPMTNQELAIYQEHAGAVERILRNNAT